MRQNALVRKDGRRFERGARPMSVEMRPAMPAALPRGMAFRAGQDRLLRRFATTVTVFTAVVAILVVAVAAVALGMT
jgi:hypothetical protein